MMVILGLCFCSLFLIPESPKYLLMKNDYEGLTACLERVAKWNGVEMTPGKMETIIHNLRKTKEANDRRKQLQKEREKSLRSGNDATSNISTLSRDRSLF